MVPDEPIYLSIKRRALVILVYIIIIILIVSSEQPHAFIMIIPLLVGLFIIITSGTFLNCFRYIQVRWQRKRILQKIFKPIKTFEPTKCCICLDLITIVGDLGKLRCNHNFHKKCFLEWYNTKPTCPCCRIDVRDTALEQIRII